MAHPVRAFEGRDLVDLVDVVGGADVLDDVEALADRRELGRVLHRVREPLEVAVEADDEARRRPDDALLDDLGGELVELRPDVAKRPVGAVAVVEEEPQAIGAAAVHRVVQGEPGRVEAAVLAPVEHRDEVTPERVLGAVLVENPGDPTHRS